MGVAEPAAIDPASIDGASIPGHVGIIMDGNGRWAKARNLPRFAGHREGVKAVRRIVRYAGQRRIKTLTLFSFSSENWSRPREEVDHLLALMKSFINQDLRELHASGVRVRILGRRDDLPRDIRELIEDAEGLTYSNGAMTLQVAFNYGGRDEIVRAARRLAEKVSTGELRSEAISDEIFAAALDTGSMADPDLIIRTSGEQRISNFLLWQAAYAEFAFVPEFWPDFNEGVFDRVLNDFAQRHRRFGGL